MERAFILVTLSMLATPTGAQVPLRSPEGARILWDEMSARERDTYIWGYADGFGTRDCFDVLADLMGTVNTTPNEREEAHDHCAAEEAKSESLLMLLRDSRSRVMEAMSQVLADSSLYIPGLERALQYAAARLLMTPERIIRCNSDYDRMIADLAVGTSQRSAREKAAALEAVTLARRRCRDLSTR